MTKHVAGAYSTTPPAGDPAALVPDPAPPPREVPIVDRYEGEATVAAATVVHGRRARLRGVSRSATSRVVPSAYARIEAPDLLADAVELEWTGRIARVSSHPSREGANLVVA